MKIVKKLFILMLSVMVMVPAAQAAWSDAIKLGLGLTGIGTLCGIGHYFNKQEALRTDTEMAALRAERQKKLASIERIKRNITTQQKLIKMYSDRNKNLIKTYNWSKKGLKGLKPIQHNHRAIQSSENSIAQFKNNIATIQHEIANLDAEINKRKIEVLQSSEMQKARKRFTYAGIAASTLAVAYFLYSVSHPSGALA